MTRIEAEQRRAREVFSFLDAVGYKVEPPTRVGKYWQLVVSAPRAIVRHTLPASLRVGVVLSEAT